MVNENANPNAYNKGPKDPNYNNKQKIELGIKIRDKVFKGNNYSQLGYLMEGLKALNILRKNNSSALEIEWAETKLDELELISEEIQEILISES